MTTELEKMKELLTSDKIDELIVMLSKYLRKSNVLTYVNHPRMTELSQQAKYYGDCVDIIYRLLDGHPQEIRIKNAVKHDASRNPWQCPTKSRTRTVNLEECYALVIEAQERLTFEADSSEWWSCTTSVHDPMVFFISPVPKNRLFATAVGFQIGTATQYHQVYKWTWYSEFDREPLDNLTFTYPEMKEFIDNIESIIDIKTLNTYLSYVTALANCTMHSIIIPSTKPIVVAIYRNFDFKPDPSLVPAEILQMEEGKIANQMGIIRCQTCHVSKNLKLCGGCKKVKYCSVKCQKIDRENHKLNCSHK